MAICGEIWMGRVTRISAARGRPGHVSVEVDGELLAILPERLLEEQGLAVGSILDPAEAAALQESGRVAAAMALANAFLAHRPRSTAEVTSRLRRAQVDEDTLQIVLDRLREQRLLDDTRFATLWVESRSSFQPRSARLLQHELRQKGVARDTIETVIAARSGDDEVDTAIAAGRKRLRAFASLDEETFRRRMAGFLARRGFNYAAVEPALRVLWAEQHATTES
jgi:regulatory protein